MFRFRLYIILTITWLAFVLNLEDIFRNLDITVHIQPFVYVIAINTVVGMMSILKLREIQTTISVSTLVLLYGIGKMLLPIDLGIEHALTAIIIELTLIIGTYFATRPVTNWLGGYSNNIKRAVFSPANTLVLDSHNNTAAIERKISLARRFERELSLLYIPMSNNFRKTDEIRAMALQRKIQELLNVLVGKGGLHAWHNGDLMVCLQGDAVAHVDTIASQFSMLIADVLKMQLQIGVAAFPTQGLILDDLIETAHMMLNQPATASQARSVVQLFPKPVRQARTVSA
jgi:hypothetical protein